MDESLSSFLSEEELVLWEDEVLEFICCSSALAVDDVFKVHIGI
jgi:hypothetical protein